MNGTKLLSAALLHRFVISYGQSCKMYRLLVEHNVFLCFPYWYFLSLSRLLLRYTRRNTAWVTKHAAILHCFVFVYILFTCLQTNNLVTLVGIFLLAFSSNFCNIWLNKRAIKSSADYFHCTFSFCYSFFFFFYSFSQLPIFHQ